MIHIQTEEQYSCSIQFYVC